MKRIINATLTLAMVGALGIFFSHDTFAQQKTTTKSHGTQFVDQDGDGVCDNYTSRSAQKMGNGQRAKGYGPGNGTGTMGQGPKDGTGYGKKAGAGTGVCDGTGPKGIQSRMRNK